MKVLIVLACVAAAVLADPDFAYSTFSTSPYAHYVSPYVSGLHSSVLPYSVVPYVHGLTATGVPVDTPEVQAAKIAHLVEVERVKSRQRRQAVVAVHGATVPAVHSTYSVGAAHHVVNPAVSYSVPSVVGTVPAVAYYKK